MKLTRFALCATTALICASSVPALAQSQNADKKWHPHIEAEGKWGTDRSLADIAAFIPVWQDNDTLVFTDIRGRVDDQSSREGNLGLAIRHQVNNEWIAGGYIFYDRRETENDNYYHQATLGLEALTANKEFRVNGYLPERGSNVLDGTGSASASVSGSSFQITSTDDTRERALPGFDIEAGYKIDLQDNWNVWGYAGAFHFDADDVENVSGPRGRIEVNYDNVPYLGNGSRFTLGYELQHDDVRDTQGFAIARLRIPLHMNSQNHNTRRLSALDERMATRIIRDIDIIAGETAGETITETATATLGSGATVSSFVMIDATGTIATDVDAAGDDALIVLDGTAGVINTGVAVEVRDGQTIIGGGDVITVTGTSSGATADLTLPGTRATVNGTNGGVDVFSLNGDDNVTLSGFDITGGQDSIVNNASSGTMIQDMELSGSTRALVFLGTSNNIEASDLDINNLTGTAIVFDTSSTTTNVTLNDITMDTIGVNGIIDGPSSSVDMISGSITATNVSGSACALIATNSTLMVNGSPCG